MSNQQDTKKKNPNVPNLRFSSFDGVWSVLPLSSFAKKKNVRNFGNHISNVICNSAQHGLIPQRDFFDKDIANDANTDKYWVIEEGDFVYNPRISNVAPYGPVNRYSFSNKGVVSPLYLVFMVSGIDKSFLLYRFQSPCWYRFMYLHGDSGARSDRVSIRDEIFLSQKVFYPHEEEQRKIAAFLRLIDQRIETQNKIIEEQISFEKAIKSMAIDSVSHDTIPLSSVFEVVKEKAGASIKATVYTASAKYGLVDEERFFKKKVSSGNTEDYTVIRNGDYVFSKSSSRDAPYGAFLVFEGKIGLVSPLYFVLRPRKKLSNITIESWFASSHCQKQMGSIAKEGARNHGMMNISLKDFLSLRLWQSIPSQYEKVFTAIKLKREIDESLLELLMKQKQFLLQEMFI